MPVRDAEVADVDEICALIEEHSRYGGNDTLALDRPEMTKHLFGRAQGVGADRRAADKPGQMAGFAFCSWNSPPGRRARQLAG